jgi:spore coat polysaccharide biosynthesis protein SpsF (cytidylyltransferase family)
MTGKRGGNIVAVVQARMGSSRLPGKPLIEIAGEPMLMRVIKRLSASRMIDRICVATTENSIDDKLVDFLKEKKIPYCRGSETDIVQRLYAAASELKADVIVRVWGDCPLIDADVIDTMIGRYREERVDFVTNSKPPSYPFGFNAEIYSFEALEQIFMNAHSSFYREFPVEYIQDSDKIRMLNVAYPRNFSHIYLTVDYAEDIEPIAKMIQHFSEKHSLFGVDDIVKYYEDNKKLFAGSRSSPRNIDYKEKLKQRKG